MAPTFLNPIFAWAALFAAAGVIVIHFYQRRQTGRKFVFTNMRLLRDILEERLPQRRLRDVLLALLRALALALALAALGRPILKGLFEAESPGASGRREFWMVMDQSFSMAYKDAGGSSMLSRSQQAAELVGRTIEESFPGASIGVFSFSQSAEESAALAPGQGGSWRQALGSTSVVTRTTSQAAWVKYLTGRASLDRVGGVFVFTDMARHGFNPSAAAGSWPGNVPVVFVNAHSEPPANRRLTARYDQGAGHAEVDIFCYGAQAKPPELALRVEDAVNHATLAASRVKNCGRTTLPLAALVKENAERPVRLALEEDRLAIDDQEYLVLTAQSEGSILIIDGEPGRRAAESESFYIREALRVMHGASRWSWITEDEANRLAPSGRLADAVGQIWLLHPKKLSPALIDLLRDYLGRHNSKLIVTAGEHVDRDGLAKLLGVIAGPAQEGGDGRLVIADDEPAPVSSGAGQSASDAKWLGTVSRGTVRAFELDRVHVSRFLRLEQGLSKQKSLLVFESSGVQTPLLAEGRAGLGRVFLLLTSADLEWSNLPLKGFFVTLIRALVEETAVETLPRRAALQTSWNAALPDGAFGPPSAVAPSGAALAGRAQEGGVSLGPLDELGIYRLRWGHLPLAVARQDAPQFLATYLDHSAQESDLAQASNREIRSLLGPEAAWVSVTVSEILRNPKKAAALLGAKELTRPFLVAVLCLLAAESAAGLFFSGKPK
ncbi:MAG: BatA domain-containing protein [Elusimicrobia bacterium]|nr:BatA domain-containing protein [Elusimicrobiota bacterium]